jgi:mono/diheme cytochrome c family protein
LSNLFAPVQKELAGEQRGNRSTGDPRRVSCVPDTKPESTPAASYPQRDSALRGRYLAAESGLCIECHTQHPASGPNAIDPTKYFQDGEDFSRLFVGTLNIHPVSANLTSDPATGLGGWTADQVVTVLLQGKDDKGAVICPPMPVGPSGAYGGLTPQDARDIANYILSLPPAVNDVPDLCSWPPTPPVDGGSSDDGGGQSADSGGQSTDSA